MRSPVKSLLSPNLFVNKGQKGQETSPKEKVALTSALAAVILTATKLAVGILTNSLGILSEALHSGIDLIAAFTTLLAVRKADAPPDSLHLYGHGKLENLSGFIETLLLFITCVWIVYEAIARLFFRAVEIEIGPLAISVMVLSMVIDYSRSRALYRAAKANKSQALEADAVHFSTDLLSSAVVIAGIFMTWLGFESFDALAAIGVAAITFGIALRLGKKTVDALLDTAPSGIVKLISEESRSVEGIDKVGRIRVRESGSRTFIDITVFINRILPLEAAHEATDRLSRRIQSLIPGSDVMVHAEPLCVDEASLVNRIRGEASNFPEIRNIHNIRAFEVGCKLHVEFDIEIDGAYPLTRAHEIANQLEERILKFNTSIVEVIPHVEPADRGVSNGDEGGKESDQLPRVIGEIAASFPGIKSCHNIRVKRARGALTVSLHCIFSSDITVDAAHQIATDLEEAIKSNIDGIKSVSIRLEPEHTTGGT